MKVLSFIAATAADALEQIRAQLGPNAVVVNVRRLPATGISRLWKKSAGIEVLACVPEEEEQAAEPVEPLVDEPLVPEPPPSRLNLLVVDIEADEDLPVEQSRGLVEVPPPSAFQNAVGDRVSGHELFPQSAPTENPWRSRAVLEGMGLLPMHAERVLDIVRAQHGDTPPAVLFQELALCCSALMQHWRKPPTLEEGGPSRPHVFVGPPGSGKTTALCKWLANAVLLDGRSAQVWRLDAHTANTAESLSVYGDILGVSVERFWLPEAHLGAELNYVDFPGVDPQDRSAFADLTGRIRSLPSARVHLVLNAAYDINILLNQARAFAALEPEDIIFTHLDEETRWGKLWNLVLGTNFTIRFLGAGQNIPGRFLPATAEQLFPPAFRAQ